MKRRLLPVALVIACFAVLGCASASSGAAKPHAPKGFFGITPQDIPTAEDIQYMKAGGIESLRWPLFWAAIQPNRKGGYDWSSFDEVVETAARGGIEVLPSIGSPPVWVVRKGTTMPVDTALQRQAWSAFLKAAVERYGPGGKFWTEHAKIGPGPDYTPAIRKPIPIKNWQIWNESNFFYFAYPVSPSRYAKLVTIASKAIKSVQPSAKVLLSGLFGHPTARGLRGMPAATFLKRLYAIPGFRNRFDGVSLHPYAVDSETLEELVEEFHEVLVENHAHPAMYITEMGWGSQNDPNKVAFEQGQAGQIKQMRGAYAFLLANAHRLNLKQVYWFSWKDNDEQCDFCDSVGLFHTGKRLRPKPSWQAFVGITGGRARP